MPAQPRPGDTAGYWGSLNPRPTDPTMDRPAGSPGAPPAPPTPPPEPNNNPALAYLQNLLDGWGLGSLTDQAFQRIIGGDSQEEVVQWLRGTEEYRTRFRAITVLQQNGYPAISPAEVIAWEQQARSIAIENGLPEGFYDSPDDFADLIGNGLSINEYQRRIVNGFVRVAQAPQEVRDYFGEKFGANGPAALAAVYLDKDRAVPILEQMAAAAEFGGIGRRFGFDISQGRAMELGLWGMERGQVSQGFGRLAESRGLFTERLGERDDLVAENQGVDTFFGTGDNRLVRKRLEERRAMVSGGGGASQTRRGVVGLGSSE